MRHTLTSPPVSLPERPPAYPPEQTPKFVIPKQEAASVSFIHSAILAMRRLDRARRIILIGLAALALLITVATVVYALLPDPAAAPAALATPPAASSLGRSTAAPSLAGSFTLTGTSGTQEWLSLQQSGDNIYGELIAYTCRNGASSHETAIINGTLRGGGQIELTMTTTQQSQTTVYALALTAAGFDLTWTDDVGHTHTQHWVQASIPARFAACPAPHQ
jgi:hypothetical protein